MPPQSKSSVIFLSLSLALLPACRSDSALGRQRSQRMISALDSALTRMQALSRSSMAFSPTESVFAIGRTGGAIALYSMNKAAIKETSLLSAAAKQAKHKEAIWTLAFSRDGQCLAAGGDDCNIRVWDPKTKALLYQLSGGHSLAIRALDFSPGRRWLASGGQDGLVQVWDCARQMRRPFNFQHKSSEVRMVAFLNNQELLSMSMDGWMKTWSLKEGKELRRFQSDLKGAAIHAALAPDKKTLAVAGDDKAIKLYAVKTGKETACLLGHTDLISRLAFSPNGQWLASTGSDNTIRIWDPGTKKQLHILKSATAVMPLTLVFSKNSQYVLSGGLLQTTVWEALSGQLVGVHPKREKKK
jgi:WD40 repeat protein